MTEGTLDPRDEALAHVEKRVEGRDDHRADSDLLDRISVEGAELPEERVDLSLGDQRADVRPELGVAHGLDRQDEGHQEEPAEDATREGNRTQPRSDDETDSQEGSRSRWGLVGERTVADSEDPLELSPDQRDALGIDQDLDQRSDPHGGEHRACPGRALLAGFDDLVAGLGFGEGKIGVVGKGPSKKNGEQHTEDAADEHQDRGLGVVELGPDAGDDESGNGEDSARGERLAHGARSTSDVLFEDGPLEGSEHGHGDDRCGEGRSDGHTGLQTEVSVSGPHDDGDEDTHHDGRSRQLLHRGFGIHVWLVVGHPVFSCSFPAMPTRRPIREHSVRPHRPEPSHRTGAIEGIQQRLQVDRCGTRHAQWLFHGSK